MQVILVGTKADLVGKIENKSDVTTRDEGEKLCKSIKAVNFFPTSAKTGDGVPDVLQEVFKQMSILDSEKPGCQCHIL